MPVEGVPPLSKAQCKVFRLVLLQQLPKSSRLPVRPVDRSSDQGATTGTHPVLKEPGADQILEPEAQTV